MNDDLPCGWPWLQQRMQDERTLESMVDGIGLRAILLMLEQIAYGKAHHAKDQVLQREWTAAAIKLGHWAKLINIY
jgi:hypothetical protein